MHKRFRVIQGKKASQHDQSQTEENPHKFPQFEDALVANLDCLFAFALRLMGRDREKAEDLLQEACLQAFKNYQSLSLPKKFKSWFFQILVNTHINKFHRQSRELPIVDVEFSEALLDSAKAESVLTPEEQIFEQLLDSEVQQALDSLPVEFRIVVWLSDVEELSYQEVSEIINCPLGTVASRLSRGHSLLREQLREYVRRHRLVKE